MGMYQLMFIHRDNVGAQSQFQRSVLEPLRLAQCFDQLGMIQNTSLSIKEDIKSPYILLF